MSEHNQEAKGGNPSADDFNGMTPLQVRQILEAIATSANTLENYCVYWAQREEDQEVQSEVAMISTMAERIGALADMPIGGEVVGDVGAWFTGHDFRRNGHA